MSEHPNGESLQAYLDGELTEQESHDLEAHLQVCPDCAAEVSQLRSLFQSIESLPAEPLATDLAPGVVAAVRPRGDWLPSLAMGELLAAAALSAGLVLWLGGAELQNRFGAAVLRLLGQLEVTATSLSGIFNDLLSEVPEIPQFGTWLEDLVGTVLISPSLVWVVAATALILWLFGNGLVLRMGKDNNA